MKKKTAVLIIMYVFSIVFSTFPLTAVTVDPTSVITFSEAKKLALLYSPEIKKQEIAVELARINARDAEVAFYKTLSASPLGASQSIWDAAVDAHKDSQVALNNLILKTEYNVEKLYLDILNINNTLEIMKKNYKMQAELVNVEKLKFELGLSTNYDLNEIIKKSKEMKRQLDSLFNNKEKLVWQMNRMIGREPGTLLELAPVTFNPVGIGTQKESTEAAMQTSLIIKQFNRIVEDKNASMISKQANQSDQAEKLEFEIKDTKLQISDMEYNIKVALENAYEQMALKQSQLSDYRTSYDMEEKNYANQKLKYELGLIGKLTLDSSEIMFDQKSIELEKAIYDYYLSVRQIDLAAKGIILGIN